jgi:hypothetical protein
MNTVCECPRAVGSNTLPSDWKCGDCVGEDGRGCHEQQLEQEQENEDDFTVKELPYRQTRIALPDDSDAYFGTDRIVFVRSKVRLVYLLLFGPRNVILTVLSFGHPISIFI